MIILRTTHGSRLYGLATPTSDHDWYEVHDHVRARQKITGNDDTFRLPLSMWLEQCDKGVPQALEAMFAPPELAEIDLFAEFRLSYRANTAHAAATYRRTSRAFIEDPRGRTAKRVRHGARILHDLEYILETGRFDPAAFSRTPESDISLYTD